MEARVTVTFPGGLHLVLRHFLAQGRGCPRTKEGKLPSFPSPPPGVSTQPLLPQPQEPRPPAPPPPDPGLQDPSPSSLRLRRADPQALLPQTQEPRPPTPPPSDPGVWAPSARRDQCFLSWKLGSGVIRGRAMGVGGMCVGGLVRRKRVGQFPQGPGETGVKKEAPGASEDKTSLFQGGPEPCIICQAVFAALGP